MRRRGQFTSTSVACCRWCNSSCVCRRARAWCRLAATVFYRLEREGDTSLAPPLSLHTSARYLRIVPDARAAALDAPQTQLLVRVQLASLVFAQQGQAPFV